MSKKQVVRVAVSAYGDDMIARATCPTTRIWVHGEDIYVAERSGGSTWKLSFHGAREGQSEAWQLGYTAEHVRSNEPPYAPGRRRLLATWQPTPFVDNARHLLVMDFYRGALCASTFDDQAFQLQFPDDHEGFVRLCLMMTNFEAPRSNCTAQVSAPLTLASGRQVWLSWMKVLGSPDGDHHPADAAILIPGEFNLDGVMVPHLKVHGGIMDFETFKHHLPTCPWPTPDGLLFDRPS